MTKTQVLEKARKLFRHARSARAVGSVAEATTFVAKVRRLVEEHRLEMADVERDEVERQEPLDGEYVDLGLSCKTAERRRQPWHEALADGVARAHGCQVFFLSDRPPFYMVGHEVDRKIGAWTLIFLVETAERLAEGALKRHRQVAYRAGSTPQVQGFRGSFYLAFTGEVLRRYREEGRRSDADPMSKALARVTDYEVDDFMRRLHEAGITEMDAVKPAKANNLFGLVEGLTAGKDVTIRGRVVTEGTEEGIRELRRGGAGGDDT